MLYKLQHSYADRFACCRYQCRKSDFQYAKGPDILCILHYPFQFCVSSSVILSSFCGPFFSRDMQVL
ncbi:hypothetical protein CY35_13G101100 [Sphagnum magellanicum]|nr:hypothetical protein CY35_13G101100 [Sphagnum magellanicum]